jgi:hypothetical protein
MYVVRGDYLVLPETASIKNKRNQTKAKVQNHFKLDLNA